MTPVTNPTATRTEYGALTVTRHIYMHDFSLAIVQAFITEFSDVCPITLVTRTWVGDTHGPWLDQLLEGTK